MSRKNQGIIMFQSYNLNKPMTRKNLMKRVLIMRKKKMKIEEDFLKAIPEQLKKNAIIYK